MSPEISTRTKTQTLSLRLDPKTRFILEFMSRVRGQSITVVVERAIKEAADRVGIGPTHDYNNNELPQPTWTDFWDPDDGVRALKLFANNHYQTTFDEDEIRRFTLDHWEFFYTSEKVTTPRRGFINILWPRLDKYLAIWRETKSSDYWAAGIQMASDLSAAKVSAPIWPRSTKINQSLKTVDESSRKTSFSRDLDDEVPF